MQETDGKSRSGCKITHQSHSRRPVEMPALKEVNREVEGRVTHLLARLSTWLPGRRTSPHRRAQTFARTVLKDLENTARKIEVCLPV